MRQFFKYLNLHGGFLALVLILATAVIACSYNSSNVQSTDPSATIPAATSAFAASQINLGQGLDQGQGASGAIASLDGNTLTLTTQQGQLTVNIGTSTSVQKTVTGNTADLQIGQSVTVTGSQKGNSINATFITIRPQNQGIQLAPPTGINPVPSRQTARPTDGAVPGPSGQPARPAEVTNTVDGRRALMGSLSKMEGNTLTITNFQEETTVNIDSNTTIQKTATGSISDLRTGESVTVLGTQNSYNTFNSVSIVIRPHGAN